MKYAMYLPNFGLCGDARTLIELAIYVEQSGWDGFFLWDHLQWPGVEPCVDPWIALAAIADRTEHITLGTMITPLPRRDIAKLARETVSIDQLSGGRLVLGVGLGWQAVPEYSGFGHETDLKKRGEMLDEGLMLLDALWSGRPVNHNGPYYRIECEPFASPVQSPRIPIWVAGTWPSTRPFRRAAQWDGVVPISKKALEGKGISPVELEDIVRLVRNAGAGSENYVVTIGGFTSDSSDTSAVENYRQAGANWWLENGIRWMESRDVLIDRIRKGPPRI